MQLPSGLGGEAAGVVEEVGAGVTDLKPADRVAYGAAPVGGYAEARLIPADRQPAFLVGSKLRPYLSAAGQKGLQTMPPEIEAYIDRIKRDRGL